MSDQNKTILPFDIRVFRLENQLTQQEMAAFLGVSQKTISRWELGVDQPAPMVQEKLQALLAERGENHWGSVYNAIRRAAVPVALVDNAGNVLVASELYEADQPVRSRQPAGAPPMQTVLVVEDDRAILKATGAVLKRWHFEALGARDGAEAVRLVAENGLRPDGAIIDFLLPGSLDGVDVARALRKVIPDLPILMISGEATPDRMRKITASGLKLIQKPVDPGQLKLALSSLLHGGAE